MTREPPLQRHLLGVLNFLSSNLVLCQRKHLGRVDAEVPS